MERFRIAVGHTHGVKPGNIVGAIANEVGLDRKQIGQIEIYDDFSTVDLPERMPKELFRALKKVWVCQQQLNIDHMEGGQKVKRKPPGGAKKRPEGKLKMKKPLKKRVKNREKKRVPEKT